MWQTLSVIAIVALALVAALRRSRRVLRGQAGCNCTASCTKRDSCGVDGRG
ncbi:MAG TPA: hypothetical protein VK997_00550 [Deferrisomatales bacterium]|nr:hypothetical protein [Deferrisomatales bacterium]